MIGKWEESIHDDFEQLKRIYNAQKIKPENIIFIDEENQTAQMEGSSDIYNVTLDSCTCFDFSSRQLPCKHIYKLAMELNLISLPKTNRKNKKEFEEHIPEEIERYKKAYLDGALSLEKFNKIATALLSKNKS